jgi:hypothetical protein
VAEVAEVVGLSVDDDDLVLRFVGAEEPDGVLGAVVGDANLGDAAQRPSIAACTDPDTVGLRRSPR